MSGFDPDDDPLDGRSGRPSRRQVARRQADDDEADDTPAKKKPLALDVLPPSPAEVADHLETVRDLRGDRILVGRDVPLTKLIELARQGRHVLLTGKTGVGKSRLLIEAFEVLTGHRRRLNPATGTAYAPAAHREIIYLWNSAGLTDLLTEILLHLWHRQRLRIPGLSDDAHVEMYAAAAVGETSLKMICRFHLTSSPMKREAILLSLRHLSTDGRPAVLILDRLDRTSSAAAAVLMALSDHATLVGAAPEVPRDETQRRFWQRFIRIPVEALSRADVAVLIEHFLTHYPIFPADRQMYRRQLALRSGGNPAALRSLLYHGRQQGMIPIAEIRDLLEIDTSGHFNMGLVYVFALLGASIAKVAMRGATSAEFYVLATIAAIIAMLVFRVFRVFFVFRANHK